MVQVHYVLEIVAHMSPSGRLLCRLESFGVSSVVRTWFPIVFSHSFNDNYNDNNSYPKIHPLTTNPNQSTTTVCFSSSLHSLIIIYPVIRIHKPETQRLTDWTSPVLRYRHYSRGVSVPVCRLDDDNGVLEPACGFQGTRKRIPMTRNENTRMALNVQLNSHPLLSNKFASKHIVIQ